MKVMLSTETLGKGIERANPGLSPDLAREIAKSGIDHALGKHPADGLSSAISVQPTTTTIDELANAISRHKKIPLAEAQAIALRLSSQAPHSASVDEPDTTIDELAIAISAQEKIPLAEAQCVVWRMCQRAG